MQALSVATTENWSACLGHYRRRGDAPHKERYAYVPNGGTLGACLETISYGYDAAGNVVAVEVQSDSWLIDGETLYYIRNGQGDITGLINSSGRAVIEYRYDTWGKDCSLLPDYQEYLELQELNPFRSRKTTR